MYAFSKLHRALAVLHRAATSGGIPVSSLHSALASSTPGVVDLHRVAARLGAHPDECKFKNASEVIEAIREAFSVLPDQPPSNIRGLLDIKIPTALQAPPPAAFSGLLQVTKSLLANKDFRREFAAAPSKAIAREYPRAVNNPVGLRLIERRLTSGAYFFPSQAALDLRRVGANCLVFSIHDGNVALKQELATRRKLALRYLSELDAKLLETGARIPSGDQKWVTGGHEADFARHHDSFAAALEEICDIPTISGYLWSLDWLEEYAQYKAAAARVGPLRRVCLLREAVHDVHCRLVAHVGGAIALALTPFLTGEVVWSELGNRDIAATCRIMGDRVASVLARHLRTSVENIKKHVKPGLSLVPVSRQRGIEPPQTLAPPAPGASAFGAAAPAIAAAAPPSALGVGDDDDDDDDDDDEERELDELGLGDAPPSGAAAASRPWTAAAMPPAVPAGATAAPQGATGFSAPSIPLPHGGPPARSTPLPAPHSASSSPAKPSPDSGKAGRRKPQWRAGPEVELSEPERRTKQAARALIEGLRKAKARVIIGPRAGEVVGVASIFLRPVETRPDFVPDYYRKIKSPMDLQTISSKLENNEYRFLDELFVDVNLMLDNARLFNKGNEDLLFFVDSMTKAFSALRAADRHLSAPATRPLNDAASGRAMRKPSMYLTYPKAASGYIQLQQKAAKANAPAAKAATPAQPARAHVPAPPAVPSASALLPPAPHAAAPLPPHTAPHGALAPDGAALLGMLPPSSSGPGSLPSLPAMPAPAALGLAPPPASTPAPAPAITPRGRSGGPRISLKLSVGGAKGGVPPSTASEGRRPAPKRRRAVVADDEEEEDWRPDSAARPPQRRAPPKPTWTPSPAGRAPAASSSSRRSAGPKLKLRTSAPPPDPMDGRLTDRMRQACLAVVTALSKHADAAFILSTTFATRPGDTAKAVQNPALEAQLRAAHEAGRPAFEEAARLGEVTLRSLRAGLSDRQGKGGGVAFISAAMFKLRCKRSLAATLQLYRDPAVRAAAKGAGEAAERAVEELAAQTQRTVKAFLHLWSEHAEVRAADVWRRFAERDAAIAAKVRTLDESVAKHRRQREDEIGTLHLWKQPKATAILEKHLCAELVAKKHSSTTTWPFIDRFQVLFPGVDLLAYERAVGAPPADLVMVRDRLRALRSAKKPPSSGPVTVSDVLALMRRVFENCKRFNAKQKGAVVPAGTFNYWRLANESSRIAEHEAGLATIELMLQMPTFPRHEELMRGLEAEEEQRRLKAERRIQANAERAANRAAAASAARASGASSSSSSSSSSAPKGRHPVSAASAARAKTLDQARRELERIGGWGGPQAATFRPVSAERDPLDELLAASEMRGPGPMLVGAPAPSGSAQSVSIAVEPAPALRPGVGPPVPEMPSGSSSSSAAAVFASADDVARGGFGRVETAAPLQRQSVGKHGGPAWHVRLGAKAKQALADVEAGTAQLECREANGGAEVHLVASATTEGAADAGASSSSSSARATPVRGGGQAGPVVVLRLLVGVSQGGDAALGRTSGPAGPQASAAGDLVYRPLADAARRRGVVAAVPAVASVLPASAARSETGATARLEADAGSGSLGFRLEWAGAGGEAASAACALTMAGRGRLAAGWGASLASAQKPRPPQSPSLFLPDSDDAAALWLALRERLAETASDGVAWDGSAAEEWVGGAGTAAIVPLW